MFVCVWCDFTIFFPPPLPYSVLSASGDPWYSLLTSGLSSEHLENIKTLFVTAEQRKAARGVWSAVFFPSPPLFLSPTHFLSLYLTCPSLGCLNYVLLSVYLIELGFQIVFSPFPFCAVEDSRKIEEQGGYQFVVTQVPNNFVFSS